MECVIISGSLSAKLRNKLFASFHKRFVELVFVENKKNRNTTVDSTCIVDDGVYELRIYKNSERSKRDMFSFAIDPSSLQCYVNYLNSKTHKFTFVCTSRRTSVCFSAISRYERDSWVSVLEQLQWQFQPNVNLDVPSKTTAPTTFTQTMQDTNEECSYQSMSSSDDIYLCAEEYVNRLTNATANFDNNYYYNYYNSNLKCNTSGECNNNRNSNRATILGLLNGDNHNQDICNTNTNANENDSAISQKLEFLKSPKYGATQQNKNSMDDIALKC